MIRATWHGRGWVRLGVLKIRSQPQSDGVAYLVHGVLCLFTYALAVIYKVSFLPIARISEVFVGIGSVALKLTSCTFPRSTTFMARYSFSLRLRRCL
jgi:hypothetical protein